MAKGWKCPHCSTENPETTLTCSGCGRLQGSVVVPGASPVAPVTTPISAETPPPADAATPGFAYDDRLEAPTPPPASQWAVNLDNVPAASTPLWRRLPIGLILFGVLVVGGAVAGFVFNASRSDTGEITRSGDLTANDLRVGDCFDLKEPDAEEIGDVTAHPCTEAHEYEVFYVGLVADGAYPGDEALTAFVTENCLPAFDAYIGAAYSSSQLDFSWLYPSSDSWGDGDRSIQCAVYDPTDTRLTTSLRGAAR